MEQHLEKIGFRYVYLPHEKKWDKSRMIWNALYDYGESICIKLKIVDNDIIINNISFQGVETLKKIQATIKVLDLSDIIAFVCKYPNSTNP